MKAIIGSMFELEAILKIHVKRYPLMQPTDAVRLIYQNEFGGGHLIRDEEICLNYLRQDSANRMQKFYEQLSVENGL